ncbi:DUF3048 domain-containing protein [Streptomyces sp. B6B3]|uniref:DUF3048 domain-containing protein n=1 Tax=Streptomyces sp. B6B3 TaxID=3153570 RepID=UPI00325ED567
MSGTARARFAVATALVAVLGLLAGCDSQQNGDGGGGQDGGDPTEEASSTSPFTGEELDDGPSPVLAVKIDNVEAARPQTGLGDAEIVYVEQVEGGLSRFLAVYSEDLPDRVGPVRSGRESDLELLEQFGEPAFAYSGIQGALEPLFEDASLFPVPPDVAPEGYSRGSDRPAPYNLYGDPAALLDAALDASEASDIGFRFGEPPARGGEATRKYDVSLPAAGFTFTWSADDERWQVALDGQATDAAPATVVVQDVSIRESEYHDVTGAYTPYTETTGSGTATVLRDGRAYDAEWSRPSAEDGTEFTTPDGDPMRFATGPVWVVYQQK